MRPPGSVYFAAALTSSIGATAVPEEVPPERTRPLTCTAVSESLVPSARLTPVTRPAPLKLKVAVCVRGEVTVSSRLLELS